MCTTGHAGCGRQRKGYALKQQTQRGLEQLKDMGTKNGSFLFALLPMMYDYSKILPKRHNQKKVRQPERYRKNLKKKHYSMFSFHITDPQKIIFFALHCSLKQINKTWLYESVRMPSIHTECQHSYDGKSITDVQMSK